MRARDKFVHRWKADRQVGHPVILAGPAKISPPEREADADAKCLCGAERPGTRWLYCESAVTYRSSLGPPRDCEGAFVCVNLWFMCLFAPLTRHSVRWSFSRAG